MAWTILLLSATGGLTGNLQPAAVQPESSPGWAPRTQPAQPAKAAPRYTRHARIHCFIKLAEELATERGYLYRTQPKYPSSDVKKSLAWAEVTEGNWELFGSVCSPSSLHRQFSQWHCLHLCCQQSLFLCTSAAWANRKDKVDGDTLQEFKVRQIFCRALSKPAKPACQSICVAKWLLRGKLLLRVSTSKGLLFFSMKMGCKLIYISRRK